MLHNLGVDLSTAEQMPTQYALAFVSEKMGLLKKLQHERQQNTHAAPKPTTSDTKSYISTERKHSKPKTGADK
ncbi:MAG: hypothetical protein O2793_17340 [Proteobacteria bacterium]|jgi:hypothetical protein|uniref:hypothetical protein n=1 Tax=Acinetobacter venetianus TaxID=52133 RepID=UPI00214FBD52|nr:hypothetical protein [Acinetobacter venetianus]MCR4529857.1 hypothetical protein [Acinetobacter venetianus]MDA0698147.1 hypothetical protein [Pseudomonadota bacterium]